MSSGLGQPQPIENRPGLAKIDYRIGEFTTVRQRLLDLLPLVLRQPNEQSPLAKLTTRADDDPAIALLDAWAVVADVLTFYQERIANEGFLRTATERRSVLELVRAIGYELSSGVAASSYLSFTVEEAPGSPDIVVVPQGTQVMSVPVKDELPQTFETSEAFTAYREWNAIRPRPNRPQVITPTTQQFYLAGSSTQLQAGDFLLLVDEQPTVSTYLLPLTEVIPNPQAGYTRVRWLAAVPAIASLLRNPQVFAFRQRASLLGNNAPPFASMPAEIKLAAIEQSGGAIRGGVVRSNDNGDRWFPASQGLPDSDILCLAVRGTTLFAGTPNKGIFRSLDHGFTWKAVNEGLTSQNVLALHISDKNTIFNEAVFAGTPNGGVFRSKDQGNNWVPINTGSVRVEEQGENNWQSVNTSLPNTVVRSLLTYSALNQDITGSGTIYSRENTVIGFQTEFTRELEVGDNISAVVDGARQTREVTQINSDTSLEVSSPFSSQDLNHGTLYSALTTVFSNSGNIVSSVSESRGTIASDGLQVIGHETHFLSLRRAGITNMRITAAGQVRTIQNIATDTLLTIDRPFTKPSLNPGTSYELSTPKRRNYLFAGSDDGLYRSLNQGNDWTSANLTDLAIYSLFYSEEQVFSGTSRGAYLSDNHGVSWSKITNDAFTADLPVFAISIYNSSIFIGTSNGVFQSQDGGANWNRVNTVIDETTDLEEFEVRSLVVYERGPSWYLVAATDHGIFVSDNLISAPEINVQWRQVSQDLAVQDMTAIAVSDTTKALFAGSVFEGFTEEKPDAEGETGAIAPIPQPRPVQNLEWPEFRIQDPRQIDLETLYPQILPNSWIVLFDDRDPQNPAQEAPPRLAVRRVDQVFAIQRSAFGLSSKITRIEPDEPINPDEFGLRSTTVFARSEALPLALEPLTVRDRGFDIFQDPIKPDTIFLRDFIQGLQPQQTLIVQGQHCRMRLDHVGGIYRSQFSWNTRNQGLDPLSIRLLKQINEELLVGTDKGLYCLSGGASEISNLNSVWERIYGLKAEPVYALLPLNSGLLLAGTEQGLYRTSDISQAWQRILALPEDSVFALTSFDVLKDSPTSISATISGTVLSGEGIAAGLRVGDIVTLEDADLGTQSRFVTEIDQVVDANQFKINAAFDPEPVTQEGGANLTVGGTALFAGMRRGLYRSPDLGATWEAVEDFNEITITALTTWETILIVGTQTGLWISRDTGQTRKAVELPNNATVRSLLVNNHHLWVGTPHGLYRVSNLGDENPTVTGMKGLRDRNILSLLSEGNDLIAGTDQGVYRSRDAGQTWITLDAGLAANQGRSLLIANGTLLVGTEAGVFQSNALGVRLEPTDWERRDTGLVNSQVIALAMDSSGTVILAGVTAGVFRSTNGGRTWEPLHDGLTPPRSSLPLQVQALLAHPQEQAPDRWFAGTPEGIFWFDAERQQWQALTAGLVYRDVRAIALHQGQIYIGTRQGGVLRLAANRLGTGIDLATARWQPTGLGGTNVQVLVSAPRNLLLAGTERDGLFLSRDSGTLWRQITETRPGRGTLSSDGNQVMWQGSFWGNQLQPGDRINAAGQTRTIINLAVQSGQQVELTVNEPFRPALADNTEFSINTGLTNRHITAIATAVPEAQAEDNPTPIWFVATAGSGVFRSTDGGDRWQQVITNLEDLEIRCMAVEQVGNSQRVWVGTAQQGVFRSDNGGDLWAAVNLNLTNTDVRAILIPPSQGNERPAVLAGGIGILISPDDFYTRPVQREDRVQVLQPPEEQTSSEAAAQGTTLWQIQVKDKDGFQGVLKTPALTDLTLLPAAEDDALVSEVVVIQDPPTDQQLPMLTFQQPLQYSYDPASFQILANVVRATHGETVEEILGSGDGNEANPRFELSKPPLTYVPADNARGAASTLNLRVNGVLWQEVPSLYPLKPQDQSYIIRIEHDGTPAITFGDGHRGARVPSGQENVSATYRSGIGTEGNVAAQSLSILKTRPQGISDVTNPLAATGGAGAETLAEARTKAPPTVRTLDRIVSLQDFEDFAQGFAGIGKAEAIAIWNGSNPLVHITVAGIQGADVPETSSLYEKLVAAIDRARDPIQQVEVASYERILFNLEGRLLLDPRYLAESVMAQVQAALTATFAFDQRTFGQSVTSAEVIEAIQGVAGVTAVDLDALYRFGRSKTLEPVLTADSARYDSQTRTLIPAQLLLLNAAGLQLTPTPTL